MGTLHDGVNISVCENNSKWFSRMRSHIVWPIYSTVYQSYMCHGSYYVQEAAAGCQLVDQQGIQWVNRAVVEGRNWNF